MSRAKAVMDLILIYLVWDIQCYTLLLRKSDGGVSGCFGACGFKKTCSSCPFVPELPLLQHHILHVPAYYHK